MSQADRSKAPLVHIGYHKTATSFLQQAVFTNDRYFALPWQAQSREAIEQFVLLHPGRFDPAQARGEFDAACAKAGAGGRIPVVSHEALSGNPLYGRYDSERVASRIHAALPDARILIGVREQTSLIYSLYLQYIKQGGTDALADMLRLNAGRLGFRPALRLEFFEFDLMYRLYADLFGPDRVLVMPLEELRQDPSVYLGKIAGFLGFEWTDPVPVDAVNAGQTEPVLRLRRRLNSVIRVPVERPDAYRDYPVAYRARNRALRAADRLVRASGGGKSRQSVWKKEIQDFVKDRFAGSNRELANLTGLDLEALGYPV